MKSRIPHLALFIGSVASGLAASVAGVCVLFAWRAMIGVISFSSLSAGLVDVLFFGATFGAVGIVAGAGVGYPLLAALRAADSLSTTSAVIAGAFAGLGVAVLASSFVGAIPFVLTAGGFLGAFCGAISLRIANAIWMRPKTSLERTREE